ncbi:AAA family ATPase [Erythrobacter sp. 3-20A1M]|uniref:ATP-dependent nuclease n=1 Tax=Erythrobacter sp. 3-20A1M TaxID=2653850 RepID=UPI001BFC0811|nr:AAA family ATPase [Erythrobacter sp. 3-20A1M]QWC56732.1 AAA family ATPase [Erythrobacter sp. 3-20A1M]
MMANRSKLLKLAIKNVGCIGTEGVEVALDDVVCLVGKNNAGKSTILRGYELAQSPNKFDVGRDRCRWAPDGEPSVVELDVHIPEGIANVAEEWKVVKGDLRILKSRWEWQADGSGARKTWSPTESDWSADAKAGGADNVFKSRLPRPLRIGSLEDADKTEELLLTLALSPFVAEMKAYQGDPESDLSKSVVTLMGVVDELSKTHEERFDGIAAKVHDGFKGVFPSLGVRLDVAMAAPSISLEKLMKEGSGIRVQDGEVETSLAQQGTGARRALFWSMLQVHNQLTRQLEVRSGLEKEAKGKKGEVLEAALAKIAAFDAGEKLPEAEDDPAFPGYLLLIDEPENALHPMAARAAQRHLYQLATDPDWQVMMTTHSPYFVNPLENHTTIVRLERKGGDQSPLERKTYRTEEVTFDEGMKKNLQALQQMDVGFSEVFFGSYPILVEGDTEHAAFIAAVVETNHELADRATVIRARGKGILPGLIRMLRHFQIPFGIVHDIDWPYTSKGGASAMWTINQSIYDEIEQCRSDGVTVRHRCSVPDFERALGGEELGKDKPLEAYLRIKADPDLAGRALAMMLDLCDSDEHLPFGHGPGDGAYIDQVHAQLGEWCNANGYNDDIRFKGAA